MATEPLAPNPQFKPKRVASSSQPSKQILRQTVAQLQQQLAQQHQRQRLIDQLTSAIRNSQGLPQIYEQAVTDLVQTLQVSRGLLLLFKYVDPRQRHSQNGSIPKTKATLVAESWLEGKSAEPEPEPESKPEPFWASDCRFCQRILTGEPQVAVSGFDQPKPTIPQPDPLFQIEQLPALLMVPLESQGTVLGCLALQQQAQDWSADDLAFLRRVAAQLSTAIIQTRSFQQVQAVVQERTAQLQRSLEVQAKLYEKTRQQVDQLHKMNAEREEFLSTISHELLTPLTSMGLAIRMLRQRELDEDRQQRYLDILDQQCLRETNLINDLLALRKLETLAPPTLQKLDLRQMIETLSQSVAESWQEKELKLSVHLPSRPLIFYSDSDSLHRALLELLTNARKYSDPGSIVELRVACTGDLTARQIVISIGNRGAGIAPEEMPYIFDKFRRGQGVTQQAIQGTGLGLALVKGLVEHLDGTITASSHPLGEIWETWFTMTLPQAAEGQIHVSA
ncbi:MAG: GAF domain-containing sensor histidine kinase [Pegethrix bostrychoides GSE-TBD4-15B]|jgi:signal transduction histidine kinase|uniref:histidine kinase n=1 Tax=Pegethrix bostrychoides GSE-TBD4-15B TaxID=2839662 RepID=A0A951PBW8_9CYAN|nr:GAF domain-containing sensor histidine kinase [Pegethrix bostrychoides GSE-TBD4-15B]